MALGEAMTQFVSKQEISQHLKLSDTTLKRYRLTGVWVEGVHWIRINSRCTRYNLDLIDDWMHNIKNPAAHNRAIENQQASLLSNQSKKASSASRLTKSGSRK
jgi:hypothetical protein